MFKDIKVIQSSKLESRTLRNLPWFKTRGLRGDHLIFMVGTLEPWLVDSGSLKLIDLSIKSEPTKTVELTCRIDCSIVGIIKLFLDKFRNCATLSDLRVDGN